MFLLTNVKMRQTKYRTKSVFFKLLIMCFIFVTGKTGEGDFHSSS